MLSKIWLLSVSMIVLPKKMSVGTVCACMTILWDVFHLFLREERFGLYFSGYEI